MGWLTRPPKNLDTEYYFSKVSSAERNVASNMGWKAFLPLGTIVATRRAPEDAIGAERDFSSLSPRRSPENAASSHSNGRVTIGLSARDRSWIDPTSSKSTDAASR